MDANSRRGFTLLEVVIATMIIGMITLTLHRFLTANLRAIRSSTEITAEREAMQGVLQLLEAQLQDLWVQRSRTLMGQALKFRELPNDEITWRCRAGAGMLTSAASGEWWVTLTVQPVNDQANETELGLRRRPSDPQELVDSGALARGTGTEAYHWLPLIRPMAAIEIRYFDAQLNAWQDAWTDAARRPNLVRVRLWKRAGDAPLEAVLTVPSSKVQR